MQRFHFSLCRVPVAVSDMQSKRLCAVDTGDTNCSVRADFLSKISLTVRYTRIHGNFIGSRHRNLKPLVQTITGLISRVTFCNLR